MQIELYVILKEIHSLFLLATLYILLYFTAVMWNEMSNNDELQADPVFANSFLATTTSTVIPGPAPAPRPPPARPESHVTHPITGSGTPSAHARRAI